MIVKMIQAKTEMQEYFKDLVKEFSALGDEEKEINFSFSLRKWMRSISDKFPYTLIDIKYFRRYKNEEDFIIVSISSILDREDEFRPIPSIFKITNDNYNEKIHKAFKELLHSIIKMNAIANK